MEDCKLFNEDKLKLFTMHHKELFAKLLTAAKVDSVIRRCNRHPRIVFWHGVDHNINPFTETEMTDFENFKNQVKYIVKNYEVISIDEMYDRICQNKFSGKEITLTFDDGFRNNYLVVAPYLKGLGIPFTVYISTHHINTGELFPTSLARLIVWGADLRNIEITSINLKEDISSYNSKIKISQYLSNILKTKPISAVKQIYQDLLSNLKEDEFEVLLQKHPTLRPMNWDEVKDIKNYNCTIGAHCIDHICCHKNQELADVKQQIYDSKRIIESHIGEECLFFAYPNGSYTEKSNEMVIAAGYKMGVSTKPTKIEKLNSIAAVPRICLPSDPNLAKLKLNIYPR